MEAMALYRYVPGREQLLDGVVEFVMNELYEQTMTDEQPNSWQEYLQKMAHGVRDIAVAHPRVFPAGGDPAAGRAVARPPLRSLRWVESFLEGLADFGFSDARQRADLSRVLHLPAGPPIAGIGSTVDLMVDSVEEDIEFFESNRLSDYPRLQALGTQLVRGRLCERVRGLAGGPDQPDPGFHRVMRGSRRVGGLEV